ncbi:uncharacterized protein LOC129243698 [Anastrepha obliqua]|uniref:uncharacterized protein LOC129243698 n=1 Tax=Anastrepha obliqua TaxID=95512 RepID=UPI00240902D2|nr:uncharacterized protein LOC129243698 [Anastrepha obliqua]
MALQTRLRICVLSGVKPVLRLVTSCGQPLRFSSTVGGCILPKKSKKGPSKPKPGRKCKPYKIPICSEEALAAKRKTRPCQKKIKPSDLTNPECCVNPCIEMHPRFDDLYYAPSEKNKLYQQTWCEFEELRIMKRPICCYEQFDIPLPERRKLERKDIPPSSLCEIAKQCPNSVHPKCVKIVWPGCRTRKCEFKCHNFRSPSDCLKVCTPYPSFSECDRYFGKPLPPVECDCLSTFGFCALPKKSEKSS